MEERYLNTAATGNSKAQASETSREAVRILVIANDVLRDPDRATFYNVDTSHEYVKKGISEYFRHRGGEGPLLPEPPAHSPRITLSLQSAWDRTHPL